MGSRNGPLVAAVASVALLAVVGGTALAQREGPEDTGSATVPLNGTTSSSAALPSSSPTPSPSTAPSTVPPTTTPSARPRSGPIKVRLPELSKLPKGRAPYFSYLAGRQVLGGAEPVTIPGTGAIYDVARLDEVVLAVQESGTRSDLLKVSGSPATVQRVRDAGQLVVASDGQSAVYSVDRFSAEGSPAKGHTLYVETGSGEPPAKLARPDDWQLTVIAYAGGKVYFSSSPTEDSNDTRMYAWTPGGATATRITTPKSFQAVSADGALAALQTGNGSCTTVTRLATGRSAWRTCDYGVRSFDESGALALAGSGYSDGYGDPVAAALDGRTGQLLREWHGALFHGSVAEDEDHVLLVADTGEETKSAIIRCAISTGQCERATELSTTPLLLAG